MAGTGPIDPFWKLLHSAAKRALGGQHSAWEVLDTSVQ